MDNHRAVMWRALRDGPATVGEIAVATGLRRDDLEDVLDEWEYARQWIRPVRGRGVMRWTLTEAGRGHLMAATAGLPVQCERAEAGANAFAVAAGRVHASYGT